MKIATETGNETILAEANEFIGIYFHKLGDFELASQYFNKFFEVEPKITNPEIKASLYYNIACNAANLHDPDKVITNLQHAFQLFPRYKEIAQQDSDLKAFWNMKSFLDLVNNAL